MKTDKYIGVVTSGVGVTGSSYLTVSSDLPQFRDKPVVKEPPKTTEQMAASALNRLNVWIEAECNWLSANLKKEFKPKPFNKTFGRTYVCVPEGAPENSGFWIGSFDSFTFDQSSFQLGNIHWTKQLRAYGGAFDELSPVQKEFLKNKASLANTIIFHTF